jgi:hypothetical protein
MSRVVLKRVGSLPSQSAIQKVHLDRAEMHRGLFTGPKAAADKKELSQEGTTQVLGSIED